MTYESPMSCEMLAKLQLSLFHGFSICDMMTIKYALTELLQEHSGSDRNVLYKYNSCLFMWIIQRESPDVTNKVLFPGTNLATEFAFTQLFPHLDSSASSARSMN